MQKMKSTRQKSPSCIDSAIGFKIEWQGLWDNSVKFMAQALCYEEDIERGLAMLDQLTHNTAFQARRLLPAAIASRFAQFGQEEKIRKVFEISTLDEDQKYRCLYQLAKHKFEQGQTQEAHEAFQGLLEEYNTNDAYLCNEWGLIFVKLGDPENAKKLFARVDERITIPNQFENSPNKAESRARGNYYFLTDRFKNGLRQESVDLVLSIEEPSWYAVPLTLYFFDTIIEIADQQTCLKLIDHANRMAALIPPNPGVVQPLYEVDKSVYRNDALWWIAREALLAGCLEEFQTAVLAAEDLDEVVSKPDDVAPTRSLMDSTSQTRHSRWSDCCRQLAERGYFDRALLAADRVTDSHCAIQCVPHDRQRNVLATTLARNTGEPG